MKMIFKALLPADLHPPMEQSKEVPVSRLLNQLPNQTSSYMLKIWKQNISNLGSCKESKSVLVKNSVQDFPGGPVGGNPSANVGNTGPGRFRLPLSSSTCELPLLKSVGSRASKPQRLRPHAAPPEARAPRACAPSKRSAIKGLCATARVTPALQNQRKPSSPAMRTQCNHKKKRKKEKIRFHLFLQQISTEHASVPNPGDIVERADQAHALAKLLSWLQRQTIRPQIRALQSGAEVDAEGTPSRWRDGEG